MALEFTDQKNKLSRRFLECVDDSFLIQDDNELKRGGSLLNLAANKEKWFGDMKVGCSDHDVVESSILSRGNKVISRTSGLEFKTEHFGLLRYLLGIIPREIALERRRPRRAGWFSRITATKLKNSLSPHAAKVEGGPHRQTRRSCLN